VRPPAWTLFMKGGVHMHSAVRVIVAIEPRMYREALAFSLRNERPEVEVSLVGSTDELVAELERTSSWRTRYRPQSEREKTFTGLRFRRLARTRASPPR
jgi:hypothetical protein